MNLGEKIKECRKQAGFSQEQLAERLNVSRQAITKWETNKGIPDIANLIAISDEFGLSLDELIKDDVAVKKKIITDSSAKKWHILMIVYLVAIVAYIVYFVICHKILMIGFLVATLFMLFFELRIFITMKQKLPGSQKKRKLPLIKLLIVYFELNWQAYAATIGASQPSVFNFFRYAFILRSLLN